MEPTAPAGASPLKGRLINLGLLLLSTMAALLLSELLLRSFVRVGSFQWHSESGHRWNSEDPSRDYVLTPGFQGRLSAPEFDHPVRINSLGFRGAEPELEERPGLVIGDSFVFGVGAREEETIPSRLALHLDRAGRPQPVWNLGIPSHSSPQYRLTLKEQRQDVRPAWIVACLFMSHLPSDANDLWGAVSFEKQRAQLPPAGAEREADPENRANDTSRVVSNDSDTRPAKPRRPSLTKRVRKSLKWLQRHSALYTFTASRIAPGLRAWRHRGTELAEVEVQTLEQGWTYLRRDLQAMATAATEDDIPMLLVHIPEASDVINGNWHVFERLEIVARELEIPLVDLRPIFAEVPGRDLYYPLDGHLNPNGYDRVAKEIATALLAATAESTEPER